MRLKKKEERMVLTPLDGQGVKMEDIVFTKNEVEGILEENVLEKFENPDESVSHINELERDVSEYRSFTSSILRLIGF